MSAAPLGFVSLRVRSEGMLVEYHASANMQVGRVETNVVGKNLVELLPETLAAALIATIGECLATQSVVNHAYSVELVDGTCYREACFAPSGADEVMAIISDVTHDRIVDARRVHLAEILEASTDYVATTDLNGRILYANRAFRECFGIETVAEVIEASYSLFSFMSPQSRSTFISDGVPELWRTGHWSGEIEAVTADGSLVPLWQAAIVHRDDAGNPEYFSGISRDITSMKSAQAKLIRSDERFRALVAEGSDVILVLTADGKITYATPAIERLLGYHVRDLIGTLAFDLIHPDDHAVVLAAFTAAFTGANSPDGLQYRVRHIDGSWVWTESHTSNHLHTPGVNGFIVNARDITARHVANERIEQASALLASVMGAAANEAIFVTDRTAAIVAFSRGAEVLLGYPADQVIGVLHPSAFHQSAETDAVAAGLGITADELFLHAPPDGQSIVREWVFVRRDGTTFDGALTVTARFDSDGALCGFLYVARDISDIVTVNDEEIGRAIVQLIERQKLVVEGAGAAAVAAVVSGKCGISGGSTVVAVLAGGNIDVSLIGRLLDYGLATSGRLLMVELTMLDVSGGSVVRHSISGAAPTDSGAGPRMSWRSPHRRNGDRTR